MQIIFLIIPENKVENVFMVLDELFLAFQIIFHHHKYFHDFYTFSCKNYMAN